MVGGIRLISALTAKLDGAQTSFTKLRFHTVSPTTQTQSEISGHLLLLLNSFPSCCWFSGCFVLRLFQPVAVRVACKCAALQVAVWGGCKVKRFAFRAFGLTLLTQQVSDWTWAGAHWGGEVDRSQSAKSLIRTCRIRSSCFIVFICLLSNFSHDLLLRFAPSGLGLMSACLFWRGRLKCIPEFHQSTS